MKLSAVDNNHSLDNKEIKSQLTPNICCHCMSFLHDLLQRLVGADHFLLCLQLLSGAAICDMNGLGEACFFWYIKTVGEWGNEFNKNWMWIREWVLLQL